VAEGWICETALHDAVREFRSGGYQTVYTVGGPTGTDFFSGSDSDTYASVAAQRLVSLGIPRDRVQMVPSHLAIKDRTYASALALREWCRDNKKEVVGFNVVTEAVHARRSRLIFEKAFGDGVAIGIIAGSDPEYDADHWWRSSEGLKEVISEAAAYLYTRFLFRPDQ
jgi:uncharacterized SAM-binding protein YcdF (DUF218 family)